MAVPPASSAYEVVPYDDRPVGETHPDRLCVAGHRAGLAVAPPERARILELGCAHGVNLVPIAYALPEAQVLGVDLSPGQIERGRARVAALGLTNLELRCADVMALDLGEQRFDYVVAHGLFSWVPAPVRRRILDLCAERLAPSGLAYVSYNAMPAWGIRGAIGKALQIWVGGESDDAQRVRRARAGLEVLATIDPLAGTAEGSLLSREIADLRDKPDAYLLHEYLVPEARAFYVQEFVTLARDHGLAYVGDVAPTGLEASDEEASRRRLADAIDDDLKVEQLVDIMSFRQFRATLLARSDTPRADVDGPQLVANMRWAARPTPSAKGDELLELLTSHWPADASSEEAAEAIGISPAEAAARVWPHVRAGRVDLRPRPLRIATTVGDRPAVSALTRFEAEHLTFVTNPIHEYAPLDSFHAALVRVADGHRDHAGLVDALVGEVRSGRLVVAGGATTSEDALRAGLPRLVEAGLQRLQSAALLT